MLRTFRGRFCAAHLAGLDARIKAAVVVGWMSTYGDMLQSHLTSIGPMKIVPGLYQSMDLPDVVAMNCPGALMIINGTQDALFPLNGVSRLSERFLKSMPRRGCPSGSKESSMTVHMSSTRPCRIRPMPGWNVGCNNSTPCPHGKKYGFLMIVDQSDHDWFHPRRPYRVGRNCTDLPQSVRDAAWTVLGLEAIILRFQPLGLSRRTD